jgi:hypothetical protein
LIGAAAIVCVLGLILLFPFDTVPVALARWRGEDVVVIPAISDLGSAEAGTKKRFLIQLWNITDHPIRVVGGTANCLCVAMENLPVTIPPQGLREVEVEVVFTAGVGRFQRRFVFYTDSNRQRIVVARFAGRVENLQMGCVLADL